MKTGRGLARELAEATTAMLRAEADLCTTDSARIDIHQKIVAAMRESEDAAAHAAKAGYASSYSVDEARLARLKAEIELEELKLSQSASQ